MKELMSDRGFKVMQVVMKIIDHIQPHVPQRAESFGVEKGMTVIDYGCGPGRYTTEFARLVGERDHVIAIDLVELALAETRQRAKSFGYSNITTYLSKGYDSGVSDKAADIVFAIDMFHYIQDPSAFLTELCRITKDDGKLILSGGHQSRRAIKHKLAKSELWKIDSENSRFIVCRKVSECECI